MIRYALCLVLLSVASIVSARDVRMHGANGDGGACPEATASALLAPTGTPRRIPTPVIRGNAKAPTSFRGGGDEDNSTPHAPRWHSFLPGMFR